jgi:putative MATE family efflux protein
MAEPVANEGTATGAEIQRDAGAASRRTGMTRRIWELAWPVIVTNLAQNVGGLLSLAIVGPALGPEGLAARNIGMRVFFTLEVFVMAVATGTAALVARSWGSGDREESERVARTSLWLSIGISVLITFPVIFYADALVGVFNLEPNTAAQAATFVRWAGAGTVIFAINFIPMAALRAAGDTIRPMWLGLLTSVIGIGTIYLFVGGWLGAPRLGMDGVGLSMVSSFAASGLVLLVMWRMGWLVVGWGPPGDTFNPNRIRMLVKIGLPAGLEQFVFSFGLAGFIWFVAKYGTEANAAYGIGVDILALSFLLGFGFSIAASTLVGQHLGADDPVGAERAGWRAMWLAIGVMTTFGAILVGTAEWFVPIFIPDSPETIRLTVVFMWCLGVVQPLMAIEFTLAGAIRGAGDTRFPLYAVLVGLLGARIGGALLVWGVLGWSVEWIYAALIPDYAIKAVLFVWYFRRGGWKTAISKEELAGN